MGGDVLSGLVGLGTLLGGVFGAKSKHLKGNFPAYVPINPTFQSGAWFYFFFFFDFTFLIIILYSYYIKWIELWEFQATNQGQ